MTPEQLRDLASMFIVKGQILSSGELSEHYRAHAAALEEVERLRAAHEHTAIQLTNEINAKCDQRDRAERAEAALADHERWLDEMVSDYRLDADPHTASKRLAINSLIHEQRTALAESERRAERLKLHADDVYVKARRVANGHNQIAAVGALTKSLDAYHDEFKEES